MQTLGSALEWYDVEKQGVNETKRVRTRTWKVSDKSRKLAANQQTACRLLGSRRWVQGWTKLDHHRLAIVRDR